MNKHPIHKSDCRCPWCKAKRGELCHSDKTKEKLKQLVMARPDKLCDKCGRSISWSNFNGHYKACSGVKKKKVRGVDFDPNIGFKNGTRKAWNKDRTKETDERIKKQGEQISRTTKGREGKPWTDLQKQKQSQRVKKMHKQFPETHPNRRLAGNRKKMTYPERLVYDYLTNLQLQPEHSKYVKGYYPDFIIKDNIVIEVDGAHWHDMNNKDYVTYQHKRDTVLREVGYSIFRIPAKNVICNLKQVLLKLNIS
jgi:very-short-patch-repair endonuclease